MIARIVFTGNINLPAENMIVTAFYEAVTHAQQNNYRLNHIDFFISSWGGSVDCGISIYNQLKTIPYPIHCYNIATIESIALPIFMVGEMRFSSRLSKFMTHEYLWPASELNNVTIVTCKNLEERLALDQDRVKKIFIERGVKDNNWNEIFPHGERYHSPDWAKSLGIIHDIKEAPTYPPTETVFWRTLYSN